MLSNLGSAVTGEIQHVDCGYHTVGMVAVDEASNLSELLGVFPVTALSPDDIDIIHSNVKNGKEK